MSDKEFYMVEAISTFHMRYLIHSNSPESAVKYVQSGRVDTEFDQRFLGEEVLVANRISETDAINSLNNSYNSWTNEEILERLSYEDDE